MKFYERPLVYIAGPYTHPDPVVNTRNAIIAGDELQETGLVTCFVPHLSLIQHMVAPHDLDHWYEYDLAMLRRCDALLRLTGESSGADKEMAFARAQQIPVFLNAVSLITWLRCGPRHTSV